MIFDYFLIWTFFFIIFLLLLFVVNWLYCVVWIVSCLFYFIEMKKKTKWHTYTYHNLYIVYIYPSIHISHFLKALRNKPLRMGSMHPSIHQSTPQFTYRNESHLGNYFHWPNPKNKKQKLKAAIWLSRMRILILYMFINTRINVQFICLYICECVCMIKQPNAQFKIKF